MQKNLHLTSVTLSDLFTIPFLDAQMLFSNAQLYAESKNGSFNDIGLTDLAKIISFYGNREISYFAKKTSD